MYLFGKELQQFLLIEYIRKKLLHLKVKVLRSVKVMFSLSVSIKKIFSYNLLLWILKRDVKLTPELSMNSPVPS